MLMLVLKGLLVSTKDQSCSEFTFCCTAEFLDARVVAVIGTGLWPSTAECTTQGHAYCAV
eukprot:scaffold10507_cov128-Cylindrotheca_fusiformis.AAC.13